MKIIGLCGFADSGKDTCADLLATHAGFRKLAFADALRAEIVEAFGIDRAALLDRARKQEPMAELAFTRCTDVAYINAALCHLYENAGGARVVPSEEASKPRTPRETLQLWGTQYRRAQDVSYWAKKLRDTVRYFMREHEQHFVITDVRYGNEAETVRNLGGLLWQVRRPGRVGELEGGHDSAVDGSAFKPERVINNGHDLRHLQQLVLGELCSHSFGLPVRLEIAA